MRWALIHRLGCGQIAFYLLGPKPVEGQVLDSDAGRDLEGNKLLPYSLCKCSSCGEQLRSRDIRTAFLEEASE
jgi:hypothetical protein